MVVHRSTEISDELVVDLFAALFEGNPSRIGAEDGGSIETDEFWLDVIEGHLSGTGEPIGAYPIDPRDGMCRWGCVDFDEGDDESFHHALRVSFYLYEDVGLWSWIERSRSKGYHVWVFTQDWLEPKIMRHALLYACEFVDAPTKEINPKQEHLDDGQVGNYVRLPYPAALMSNEVDDRRVMVDGRGKPINVRAFVQDAWDHRADVSVIGELADRYKPKPRIKHDAYGITYKNEDGEAKAFPIAEPLPKSAMRLFNNGPRDSDRSSALVALAGDLARSRLYAHLPDEAEHIKSILVNADERWGKYSARGDADIRLDEIVDKVLGERDSLY